MDPLEWLARLADHIPDPGKHRTLAYGHYANRARGARAKETAQLEGAEAEVPTKPRCSPNWARLTAKVYHADPLVCKRCGGRLAIVALITEEWAIKRILEHLGLTPPQQERPPPSRELVRVAVDEKGREIQAS